MTITAKLKRKNKTSRILVADDDADILALLKTTFASTDTEVFLCNDGRTAFEMALDIVPDLFLFDISMPELDGYQVCERIKLIEHLKDIPVIFMSGNIGINDKIKAFGVGAVDFIAKPFHIEELKVRVNTHLSLSTLRLRVEYQEMIEKKIRKISEAQQATIFALAKLAEQRDDDTGAHLERVCRYCEMLARQLAADSLYSASISPAFIDCIQQAAPMHDIGKISIPDNVLLKPATLTPEEFETMKSHTVVGAENMQMVFNKYPDNDLIGMGIEIALYHHECWDGSGYPDGLVGKNIPLSARIMTVADCYDALRSDRCYRKGFDHETVKGMLIEESGTHFDPEIIKAFLAIEADFKQISK